MSIQQIIVIEHDWNSKSLVSRGQEYGCIWTCQYLTGNTMLQHCSAAVDLGVLYFQTDSNFASEAPTDRDWTKNTTVHFHRAKKQSSQINQRKQANTNFHGFNGFKICWETTHINRTIWVCLKMLCTPKPNGFADHYPYEKWLFHWEYTWIFHDFSLPLHGFDMAWPSHGGIFPSTARETPLSGCLLRTLEKMTRAFSMSSWDS